MEGAGSPAEGTGDAHGRLSSNRDHTLRLIHRASGCGAVWFRLPQPPRAPGRRSLGGSESFLPHSGRNLCAAWTRNDKAGHIQRAHAYWVATASSRSAVLACNTFISLMIT